MSENKSCIMLQIGMITKDRMYLSRVKWLLDNARVFYRRATKNLKLSTKLKRKLLRKLSTPKTTLSKSYIFACYSEKLYLFCGKIKQQISLGSFELSLVHDNASIFK